MYAHWGYDHSHRTHHSVSHFIANDFQEAIENDDLNKFISLLNFTSNRKHVLENLLLDFFEIRTLVQEICAFFEFPALKEIEYKKTLTYLSYYRNNIVYRRNIWDSLCFKKNCAVQIFTYILQNPDLDVAVNSGLKHYFSFNSNQNPDVKLILENANILSKILKSPKLTENEFQYGLQEIMEKQIFGNPKYFKLFFNHELIHSINPFDGIIWIWKYVSCSRDGESTIASKTSSCRDSFLQKIIKNGDNNKEAILFCIKNSKFNINHQNYLGNTAFHTFIKKSTALEFTDTKFEIMNAFLSRKDFNVKLKNKQNKTIFNLIQDKQNKFDKKEDKNFIKIKETVVKTKKRIKKTEEKIKNLKSDIEHTKRTIKYTKNNMKKFEKGKTILKRKLETFRNTRKKEKDR